MISRRALPAVLVLVAISMVITGTRSAGRGAKEGRSERVESVFYNARIYTMDDRIPFASALATGGGRIIAAGSDDEILALASDASEKYDMKGATIVPGLVDAHAHFSGYALSREWIDLTGTASLDEVRELVRQRAAGAVKGRWIIGRGWDQNDWEGPAFPGKNDFDDVCPDNPLYLVRVCGHAAVANPVALGMAGIDAATPDPDGGRIEHDASGEPSGILMDEAKSLVSRVIPKPSREDRKRLFVEAAAACVARGLTGVHDMGIGSGTASIYRELYREELLPIRLTVYYSHEEEDIDSLLAAGPVRGYADGRFEAVGVKFYMDGSLGARSAALLEDYSDDPGNRGILVTDPEVMLGGILECSKKGFPAAIHAIGDRGNRTALDILEKAGAGRPGYGLRHRIEHAQVLAPEDAGRFAGLGVIPSMQFIHCTSDMPWAGDRIGERRIRGAYAWRDLLASGCRIPGGSDFPVESIDPLRGIYAAVTRMGMEGDPPGGWFPDQCLTVGEALRAFTLDAAWAAAQEEERGSITPGKMADLTVLSRDIMKVPAREILDTEVLMTVIGGQVVYTVSRPEPE